MGASKKLEGLDGGNMAVVHGVYCQCSALKVDFPRNYNTLNTPSLRPGTVRGITGARFIYTCHYHGFFVIYSNQLEVVSSLGLREIGYR